MITIAAKIAESRNKYEYHLKMDEATLIEFLKKVFLHWKTMLISLVLQKNSE